MIGVVITVAVVGLLLCAGAVATIGAIAGWWASSQANLTRTSTSTFTVPAQPQLVVSNTAGNVTIVTGSGQQIVVDATRHASDVSNQQAQHVLDEITVNAFATANGVQVEATNSAGHPLSRQSVDLRITVPATTNVQLDLTAGNFNMTGVTGQLAATLTAGNFNVRDAVLSGSSRVTLNAGNADLRVALQPNAVLDLQVHAGNATIALPQDTSTLLNAQSDVGNVTVNGWPATISRSGAGAHTEAYLKLNPANRVNVTVNVGNIVVSSY